MSYRYYSMAKPLTAGNYPQEENVTAIHGGDCLTYWDEIGQGAFGYIDYKVMLSTSEIASYGFLPVMEVPWWIVTVQSNKHGGGLSAAVSKVMAVKQPADAEWETTDKEFKSRCFTCEEEAREEEVFINNLDVTFERVRMSVTQAEVKMFVHGQYVLNFGDEMEVIHDGTDYYGTKCGCWASTHPDSRFVLGLIWNPFDDMYHYSDMIRAAVRKAGNDGKTI